MATPEEQVNGPNWRLSVVVDGLVYDRVSLSYGQLVLLQFVPAPPRAFDYRLGQLLLVGGTVIPQGLTMRQKAHERSDPGSRSNKDERCLEGCGHAKVGGGFGEDGRRQGLGIQQLGNLLSGQQRRDQSFKVPRGHSANATGPTLLSAYN